MMKKIKNEMGDDKEMKLGQWAEQQALTVLEEQGYVHIQSNYHSRFGEIDLIVHKGQELVFCGGQSTLKNAFCAGY